MSLQPRNCVVLIHHSISSLTVCIVGEHVTYVRIQKTQIDGGRPICVDQLYRSTTKLRTSNTSLRSVLLEMMYWQKKYVATWLVRYLTYMRPKLDTTGIACVGSLQTGCCQQAMTVGPLSPRSQHQPDMAWKHVVTTLSNDQKPVWNTVELQQEYQDHGGVDFTRSHN